MLIFRELARDASTSLEHDKDRTHPDALRRGAGEESRARDRIHSRRGETRRTDRLPAGAFSVAIFLPDGRSQELSIWPRKCRENRPPRWEKSRAKLGTVIIASLFERRSAGLYHNTAAIIDADGKLLGKYRKMHIPGRSAVSRKILLRAGRSRISGVGHSARQDRRLRLLGPMVSGSGATDRVARRRDYFLSNGNRLASGREKGIWKSATFRVGDDSAQSCDREWVLRRGGESRRSRSACRWRWH